VQGIGRPFGKRNARCGRVLVESFHILRRHSRRCVLAPDVFFKAAACLGLAILAVTLVAGRRPGPAPWYLAAFLALLALNQGLEAWGSALGDGSPARPLLRRLAGIVAAVDPVLLLYYGLLQPAAARWNRWWLLAPALGTCAVVAAIAVAPSAFPIAYEPIAAVYTAALYAVALGCIWRAYDNDPTSAATRLMLAAMSVAALPAWARVGRAWEGPLMTLAGGVPPPFGPSLLPAALAVAAATVVLFAARVRARSDPWVPACVAFGLSMAFVLAADNLAQVAVDVGLLAQAQRVRLDLGYLFTVGGAFRWLAFAVLTSVAAVRFSSFGMGLGARRRAARALLATSAVLGLLLVLGGYQRLTGQPTPLSLSDGLLLLASAAGLQSSRRVVDRTAGFLFGVPAPGDLGASLDLYRAAAIEARARGKTLDADPGLRQLREDLGISASVGEVVERMVAAPEGGPLVPGAIVAARYRVVRLLGRGGGGRVFLARDEAAHADVVVKEVLHDADDGDAAGLREARAASATQHPNVLRVLELLQRPGVSLIITEYVSGGNLAEHLATRGRLPLARFVPLADGILAGLEAVHAAGVVHRDLKPANILLTPDGLPKISDFGIATARPGATAAWGSGAPFAGTPGFVAPEQARGERAGPSADVYAVARLLQECSPADLPSPLGEALRRALSEDPGARGSVLDLRRAVAAVPTASARPRRHR
jgi:hypothetical protein